MEAKRAPTRQENTNNPYPNNIPSLSLKRIKLAADPLKRRREKEKNNNSFEIIDIIYTSKYVYETDYFVMTMISLPHKYLFALNKLISSL
ncbi:hypothetical protein [Fredinandcohnia sp. 179-A 10B2 NHS]|uniref:hypothetical protein n=1 Tax=Fredinandcohnia sp. 179-A 10B2 NHS TaxID=3235176 RepID=UPI0039A1A6C6